MPVNLSAPDPASLLPVAGVRLGIASAGIKKPGRRDITLIELAPGSQVAGVFTQNRFCAAPVVVCKQHLAAGAIRALLINTGNANAGTGEEGLRRARRTCEAVAQLMGCAAENVLPFSTGVILEPLPVDRTALGRVTQAAFGQRRKMLRQSLKSLGGEDLLARAGIDPTRRPETLTVAEFVRLANVL